MHHPSPLIVDPDRVFLDACLANPKSQDFPPLVASTGSEAQRLLSDMSVKVMGVFVNPKVSNPNGISVIRCAHQRRPGTAVYLLSDSHTIDFDKDQLRHLGIQGVLEKPTTYAEIAKLVMPT